MKKFNLNNEVQMPAIGFGTYKLTEGNECFDAVKFALENNYRHIDTASVYGNEKSVGKAIRQSKIPREDLFITTKVWNTDRGYDATIQAFNASLERLGLDYLDLYLVHWPANSVQYDDPQAINLDTWKALETLYLDGKVRAIGVSNFLVNHLEDLFRGAAIRPMVNQIEYHPGYLQQETVDFCKKHDIAVQAWSPLGRGRVLEESLLVDLANKYQTSTGAICLQFAIQNDITVLPKSKTPERIIANTNLNFELSSEDIIAISKLPELGFSGLKPDEVILN